MDTGNVPEAQGTGLRQFSGILSVVDISGNNIATFTSSAIVLGNSTDIPIVEVISPFVQINGTGGDVLLDLNSPNGSTDQKHTLLRTPASASTPGQASFTISSTLDATPTVASSNLLAGQRNGDGWNFLRFGDNRSPLIKLQSWGNNAGAFVNMTPDQGVFQANYTGFTTTVTGQANWYKIGGVFIIFLQPVTGTSNANTFSINNIPAAAQPNASVQFVACPSISFIDNGVNLATNSTAVCAQIVASTITFVLTTSSLNWTSSGTKGIQLATTLVYTG